MNDTPGAPMKAKGELEIAAEKAERDKGVRAPCVELLNSTFFQAGRKARANLTPITQSALRMIRPGCNQYDEFIDGYDYESALRKRRRAPGDIKCQLDTQQS